MARRGGKRSRSLLFLSVTGSVALCALLARAQTPPPPPPTPPPPATQAAVDAKTPQKPGTAATAKPSYERVWQASFDATTPAYLTATTDLVFVSGPATPVVARRATDGTEVWRAQHDSAIAPIVGDGFLVIRADQQLRAFDAAGAAAWTTEVARPLNRMLPISGAGATSAGLFWIPLDVPEALSWTAGSVVISSGTSLRAFRMTDGVQIWGVSVPAPVLGRVAIDGGRVFAALADRTLHALDLNTGVTVWQQKLSTVAGSLAAAAGYVYFGGEEGGCFAYRQSDGEQKWWYNNRTPTAGVPAADTKYAYFVLLTNQIHALDRERGNERWDERLAARLSHGIIRAGDGLFVALGDGAALKLQAATGVISVVRAAPTPAERSAGHAIESLAVSPDGTQVYTLTVDFAQKYTLSAYRQK